MTELTCIVCPIGCRLKITKAANGELQVSGNRCPRGAAYAVEEITAPKRVVTASCRLAAEETAAGVRSSASSGSRLAEIRRIPVKTSSACPKEQIEALLSDIYKLEIQRPVKRGDVLIKNWKDSGIDVVAVRTVH